MKVGSLVSPEVNVRTACLSFAYKLNLRGGHVRLRVRLNEIYGNQEVPRTKKTLSSSDRWKNIEIRLASRRSFKVK